MHLPFPHFTHFFSDVRLFLFSFHCKSAPNRSEVSKPGEAAFGWNCSLMWWQKGHSSHHEYKYFPPWVFQVRTCKEQQNTDVIAQNQFSISQLKVGDECWQLSTCKLLVWPIEWFSIFHIVRKPHNLGLQRANENKYMFCRQPFTGTNENWLSVIFRSTFTKLPLVSGKIPTLAFYCNKAASFESTLFKARPRLHVRHVLHDMETNLHHFENF